MAEYSKTGVRADIKRLNEELEKKVAERTRQLESANNELRKEINERKRTEALLYAREEEFRAIVENTPDNIARYDREFRRTYVNPAFARALNLPAETLIGKTIFSSLPDAGVDVKENELAQIRQCIKDVFDTGISSELEVTVPLPGGPKYYSVRFSPEPDLNGSVINVLAIARDITERRITEEELTKEKEILEKIFENIPVMIGFIGDDGDVKLVNPEWERKMGWTLKEIETQHVDIFEEAYPDLSYRKKVLDFVAAATGEWEDLKIKVKDGRVIDAACAVAHLSDGTKIAIAQDITERKQSENALRKSEDGIRLIIDTIPTMAWSILPDGTVDFLNQRWLDYTGLTLEQYVNAPMDPVHPEDIKRAVEKWLVNKAAGKAFDDEIRLRRTDGEYRWFLIRTAPLHDEQGKIVKWYGVSIDIEDSKQAKERLKQSYEEIRRLTEHLQKIREEERTSIAREIHDELGQQLTAIKMDAAWIDKKTPGDSIDIKRKLKNIIGLLDGSNQSIRRILSELRPRILDDQGLLEAIEWLGRQFSDATGIPVEFTTPEKEIMVPGQIATSIFRVCQEAFTNITRYALAKNVSVSLSIVDETIMLIIRDDGIGFDTEAVQNNRSFGILGMKERVLSLRGEFELVSSPGNGTKITIRMPHKQIFNAK